MKIAGFAMLTTFLLGSVISIVFFGDCIKDYIKEKDYLFVFLCSLALLSAIGMFIMLVAAMVSLCL